MGLVGLVGVLNANGSDDKQLINGLIGLAFGASLISIFARLGGGERLGTRGRRSGAPWATNECAGSDAWRRHASVSKAPHPANGLLGGRRISLACMTPTAHCRTEGDRLLGSSQHSTR